ncbi:ATP phosphoribosyltransferase [Ruminococcaceae bacterium OttesenSCG-928-L11]|nr:ATP phosphoribosyltransferase [Ruminococcaceae bacterium OttesenSCG-928-L11]
MPQGKPDMLNIALPKGRLGDKVYALFAQIGYDCELYNEANRKLVISNEETGVSYFLVKPSDVAIYVERGAADIGVVGKDTLIESGADVYELLDLGLGKCRVAVAGPTGYREDRGSTLRVATKYGNIAKKYYASRNRDIEIIKLNGSIELAPILGLSDVIVDIVETGSTLRENNLAVLEEIMPISARLIANKSEYKFKKERIDSLTAGLRAELEKTR